MPTISFEQELKDAVARKPELRAVMLQSAITALFSGDLDEGRISLRNYVNATIGFKELARRTGKIDKNLMRMLGANGNPTAANLFEIINVCAEVEGVSIEAKLKSAS